MFSLFELPAEFQLSTYGWIFALAASFLIGLSKSGIKGIDVVNVTLLALVFGGKASTGIMVPMLMLGDICAVIYYNRHAQWVYLFRLIPWMMAGVLLGVWFGKDLPEATFKQGMAIIIFVSVIIMYWWDRKKNKEVPHQWWFAGIMGSSAGFTTMVGNLAGAFANIFFLAMRMPKDHFIGTAAWLFFIMNIFKAPFHIFFWKTITLDTLALNLRMFPILLLGFGVGIWLVKQIKDEHYRQLILLLTAIGAIAIFFR